jgi:signal recognition particle subunit SRP54
MSELTLERFASLLSQVRAIGGLGTLLAMVPTLREQLGPLADQIDDAMIARVERMVAAMAPEERADPTRIDVIARERIAAAAQVAPEAIARLLEQFAKLKALAAKMGGIPSFPFGHSS